MKSKRGGKKVVVRKKKIILTDTARDRVACPRLKNVTTMSNGLEQNEDGDPKGSAMGNG